MLRAYMRLASMKAYARLGISSQQHVAHGTAQRSAAQHSTAQHSTAQHSTAQHSRGQQQTNADLQKLAKACDNTTADELRNIHARGPDGSRISAPDAVDPLHGEHPGPTQVPPHPRDLHLGVIAEVPVEVLQVNRIFLQ